MPATAAAPAGFIGWIATYGSIIGFFVQIVFYIVVSAAAAWAAVTFARYVKFMTTDEIMPSDSEAVSVEEFVE